MMVHENDLSNLEKLIQKIDSRLTRIENELSIRQYEPEEEFKQEQVSEDSEPIDEKIEFRFGQRWFAKFGIIAFLLAVINFIVLPITQISPSIILIIGAIIGTILIISPFINIEKIKDLSGYLFGSGIFILYFSALKLHFFSSSPIFENLNFVIIHLYAIALVSLIYSVSKRSQYLSFISFLLLGLNSLLSDSTFVVIITLLILGTLSVILSRKLCWDGLLNFSIIANFITQFLWFINNPLLGNQISLDPEKSYSVIVTIILITLYGFGRVKQFEHEVNEGFAITRSIFNSLIGLALSFYLVLKLNNNLFFATSIFLTLLFISIAAYHYISIKSKIVTFIYSMVGYTALSIGIISYFGTPLNFVLLCWQSVLVVSTALWFRSKIIVIANIFIFVLILIANFISGNGLNASSLNFGIVALISARLINWQKNRLGLETQNIRNTYLIIATIINPIIIYNILPGHLIGIAWICLAFIYYFLGKILENKKYRLMSTFTLILALIYSFIFGLTAGEPMYKIISFAVVSISLILMSVIYSKLKS